MGERGCGRPPCRGSADGFPGSRPGRRSPARPAPVLMSPSLQPARCSALAAARSSCLGRRLSREGDQALHDPDAPRCRGAGASPAPRRPRTARCSGSVRAGRAVPRSASRRLSGWMCGVVGAGQPGLGPGMHRDRLHLQRVDADQPRFPAHPHLAARVFRRHRVVRLVELDVAVEMHAALALREARKEARRQRLQGGLLHLQEVLADVPAGGPVDAGVGDVASPTRPGRCSRRPGSRSVRPFSASWTKSTPRSTRPLCRGILGFVGRITVP